MAMPVIIAPSHFSWWLKDDDARSESHKMALERAPDEALKIYPVSDLVNSPKTDDPAASSRCGLTAICLNGNGGVMDDG
jgi:putative SOS response-associated peptidase YedK